MDTGHWVRKLGENLMRMLAMLTKGLKGILAL